MYGDLAPYDVFNASLLADAEYDGPLELPVISPSHYVPEMLIPFTHARAARYDLSARCLHFYEHDRKFLCIWRNPRRYLPLFRRCRAVIGPDFSLYRNMPEVMQQWNCFKSRAISRWLQSEGIEVIPNVRISDERSLDWVFDGLPKNSVMAMSTVGCCKYEDDRGYFKMGVDALVDALHPSALVINGATPDGLFLSALQAEIPIISFESQFSLTHKRREEKPNGNR
ncbi:DUF4417 domain-containing protein [uncultured Parolsenella sp.]|uniref:DUF4417 domain-containing protein n=1 Tax=uncultured Parolsenella sp. TaxID=2083008 RepID=UPI0025ED6460|nr:DUF4417 domain-containing protein [uncultured Parolsenella sp.]